MRTSNYDFKNIRFDKLQDHVMLPKFQRNLVWTKEKRDDFIDTVTQGDPFGVMLLYQNGIDSEYLIIDGLQRFTTLIDFYEKTLSLF